MRRSIINSRGLVAVVGLFWATQGRAQQTTIPSDTSITLERTACFGACPVYTVSIDATGNVVFEGAKYVRVQGRQTDRIPESRVAAILEHADRLGFFDLEDEYRVIRNQDGSTSTVTDLPTAIVGIVRGGRSKRVLDYFGAPKALKDLEREIDEAAQTKRWTAPWGDPGVIRNPEDQERVNRRGLTSAVITLRR